MIRAKGMKKMTVSVTINETKVEAQPGMTVLEAAQANNIYIPTLCHAPKLPSVGACRMCVVEVENMRGFPTACTVPVTDGMVVHTETEKLKNLRREVLSLILSEHPYTCLVCQAKCGDYHSSTIRKAAVTTGCQYCPSNGKCELQDLVDYLEVEDIPYPITYRGLPVEQDDPFFDRDYNLCILCGRCIRTCQEVRHAGVLAFIKRGSQTIVGTAFDRSHIEANCLFCGACVDSCPTGALADKRGKWEGVPDQIIPSVCPYCSVGCAVNVQVKDGKVIRAVGHNDGLTNDGQLCMRGRFGVVDVVHNLARQKVPLVRRNGRLLEASWEEALGVIAENLGQYRDNQFALIASATETNETNYALQKLARTVMRSNNVALVAGYPEQESSAYLIDQTLKNLDGPAIQSVREAACIVAIGTNLFESHPILGLEVRHALSKGAGLITVDTRQTKLAKAAELWLQPKMATDHLLLAGLIKAVVDQGISSNGTGQLDLGNLDLNRVSAVTGIEQAALEAAARRLMETLSASEPIVIIYGSGVTDHPTAADTLKAIRSLAGLLDGAGVIGVPGEGNFVGAHDMGLHPALLPGYRSVAKAEDRAVFETAWGASLNPEPGQSYEAILDQIRQSQVKALYLAGEMPPMAELDNLEFLVVQDIISTEHMQYADVVLPTTTFAEMEGTLTNLEGRVQHLRPAISPVGVARPGWMIAGDIARALGDESWSYQSAAEVMAEIGSLVPSYGPVNYEAPDVAGTLRRFGPPAETELVPFNLNDVPQLTNEEFPLTLITERNLFYYHGACLTEQVKGMNLVRQEEILHLNQADATRFGVTDGDLVKVVSPYGSTECIVQVANGMMPEGTAFASFNRVNSSPLFPALTPRAKAWAIRIEEAEN